MFRTYLKHQPVMAQLAVFIGLWSLLQLIILTLIPILVKYFIGSEASMADLVATNNIQYPNALMWINFLAQIIGFVIPAILFAYLSDPKPFTYLEFKPIIPSTFFIIILLGFGILFVFPVMGSLLQQIKLGDYAEDLQSQRAQMEQIYFNDKSSFGIMRNIFLLALVPAISEELFFRGVVQRFINSWFKHPIISIAITSFLFAMVHLSVYNFLPIFLAGMLLGYVFHLTGNIWMNIVLHFIYNGLQVVMQGLNTFSDLEKVDHNISLQLGIFIGASLVVIALLYFLKKNSSNPLPQDWSVYEPILIDENQNQQ